MTDILLFEDYNWNKFTPLIYTKHLSELLLGGLNNLERFIILAKEYNYKLYLYGRPYLKEYIEEEYKIKYYVKKEEVQEDFYGDTIIAINSLINTDVNNLLSLISLLNEKNNTILLSSEGYLIGFNIKVKSFPTMLKDSNYINMLQKTSYKKEFINVDLIIYPWDLITKLSNNLVGDILYIERTLTYLEKIEGNFPVYLGKGVKMEDNIFFDTTNGPIVIQDDVKIESHSIIRGPAWIRRRAQILSAKINKSIVGVGSKVGTELDSSIVDDYSNAAHHGFIGHSYVGKWVNIGAQTTFSDLKNTYGSVKIHVNGKLTDSKLIKLGVFISDYVKTAIGSTVFCGKWIGVASHIYGMVYRDVPSFIIWSPWGNYELDLDEIFKIHERMFNRRDKKFESHHKSLLKNVFELTKREREKIMLRRGKFIPGSE